MKNASLAVLGTVLLAAAAVPALADHAPKVKVAHFRSLASSEEVTPAEERYSILGMLDARSFTVNDKKIGPLIVYQVDEGSAANPVNVYLVIPAPDDEQQGDNVVDNVFHVGHAINNVKSVKIVGNDIVITGNSTDVEHENKLKPVTYKVTYKDASGKVLKQPSLN